MKTNPKTFKNLSKQIEKHPQQTPLKLSAYPASTDAINLLMDSSSQNLNWSKVSLLMQSIGLRKLDQDDVTFLQSTLDMDSNGRVDLEDIEKVMSLLKG